MKLFGNTKHRIAELKHDLSNTTRLAVGINCAVDRIEGDLKKALEWISTADHVIVNLSQNVQKLSDLAADRIARLSDDTMAIETALLDRIRQLESAVDERVAVINENTTILADAAGLGMVNPAAARRARRRIRRAA